MPVLALPTTRAVVLAAPTVAAASWTPLDLGAGLLAWFEGDGITQADGSAVAQWDDLSGNARHAAEATNQPTYETNELNGKPVIRFDATNDVLSTASVTHGIGTGDFAMAVVVKTPAALTGYRNTISIGSELPAFYLNNTKIDLYINGDKLFDDSLSTSTWYTLIATRTGTDLRAYINGTQDADTALTSADNIPSGAFHVGAGGGAAASGMDIAAALFFAGTLSAGDRQSLEGYWQDKYAHY